MPEHVLRVVAALQRDEAGVLFGAIDRTETVGRLIGRAFRKLFRIRRLSDLTSITFRVGEAFGRRFGPVDTSRPQLEPPPDPAKLLSRA